MAAAPLDIQPYQPAQLPDPVKPPRESPFQGQPGYQFKAEPITKAGGIAGILDGVLHGVVNGMAQGQAHKALLLKKKSDDLGASYNADAQRLYQVSQAQLQSTGKIDPSAPDYQAAQSAVQGSWGALTDFRTNLLAQQDGGKSKTKGSKKDANVPPAQVLTDPNSSPQEKAAALHSLSLKVGPPVIGQIQTLQAQYASPQAVQARQTTTTQGGTAAATAESQNKLATMASKIADLTAKGKLTPEEQTELDDTKHRYTDLRETLNPTKMTATDRTRYSDDGKFKYMVDAEGNEIEGTRHPASLAQTKPRAAWGKDDKGKFYSVLVDPATNQEVPSSRNFSLSPPASVAGSIKTGEHFWQDNNNNIVETPYTTTSRPAAGNTPTAAPATTSPTATPHSAATPTSTAPPPGTPTAPKLTRRTKTAAAVTPPAGTTTAAPPSGDASGSKILGHAKISGPDATELNTLNKSFEDARQASQAARNAVAAKLRGENDSLADKGLALSWIKARMSRITQKEIDSVNNLGGLKLAWDGKVARVLTGEMSDQQRALFARGAAEAYHDSLNNLNETRTRLGLPPIKPAGSKAAAVNPGAPSKGVVSIDDAMKLPKYHGKSRQAVSDAITAQGYTPQ